jgi:hypothetical protein
MNFTLGLSGWTANDWSRAGNFDLMAPRATVEDNIKQKVFAGLKKVWLADASQAGRSITTQHCRSKRRIECIYTSRQGHV